MSIALASRVEKLPAGLVEESESAVPVSDRPKKGFLTTCFFGGEFVKESEFSYSLSDPEIFRLLSTI